MTETIQLRNLGKSALQVTPIGLGMMEFSGGGGLLGRAFPVINQEEKNAIVQAALDGGINWFDTAEMYGAGVSERTLTNALKAAGKTDSDVMVATKWLPLFRTAANIPRTIATRLANLQGFPISLYMIHQPWSFSSPEAEMDAMARLVQSGQIRSVGVSNFNPDRMRRAQRALAKFNIPLAVNQVRYSLLDRSIETNGILETARELGVTIIAYTPIASGLLSGKYHRDPSLLERQPFFRKGIMRRQLEASRPVVDALTEIGANYQATPAQVALNWVINARGDIVVTIPGATKVRQAQESAAAMKFKLSPAEIARLDKVSASFR